MKYHPQHFQWINGHLFLIEHGHARNNEKLRLLKNHGKMEFKIAMIKLEV